MCSYSDASTPSGVTASAVRSAAVLIERLRKLPDTSRIRHGPDMTTSTAAVPRTFPVQFFGGITSTVPWARHTVRPSLVTSIWTTAVRFVRETICAAADSVPPVTGAR